MGHVASALDAEPSAAAGGPPSAATLDEFGEVCREITATLDPERVAASIVNLAARLVPFDRCALLLARRGRYEVRALAGADEVEARDPAIRDLALRGTWAARQTSPFYLAEADHPLDDRGRELVRPFRAHLARDGMKSVLYLPLRDPVGCAGVLMFEGAEPDFMTLHERTLAIALAKVATSAVRNALAYHRLPLANLVTATTARVEMILEIPRARRVSLMIAGALVIAGTTLIRWPLRISGVDPTFRAVSRAEVRPTLEGVIDRVLVREGTRVERGAPMFQLRDDELRVRLDAARAALAAAERSAAIAAARGAAADERLERLRSDVLRKEADLLEEQVRAMTVRAPISGVVLSPRPEERVGAHAEEGELLAVLGRTDSLELDFGVDQRDIARVHAGSEVRLRVTALPQRTFSGRVAFIEPQPAASDTRDVTFPVRALVANPDGLLRPGMAAYARVLSEPASLLGRLTRDPARAIRLLWWRMWS